MLKALTPLLCLFATLLTAAPLHAQSAQDAVRVEMISGWRMAPGHHIAGIKVSLAEGWKTYWRVPGDAGIPPHLDWQDSEGITAVTPQWPVPEAFTISGMEALGYRDRVVFPLHIAVKNGPAELNGMLEIGVCKDICIPIHVPLQALLPDSTERDPQLAAALVDRAMTAREAGAGSVTCRFRPSARGLTLDLQIPVKRLGAHEIVVVELARQDIWVSEAKPERDGNLLHAQAELILPRGQPAGFDRSKMRITVIGDGQAVELDGCTA